MSPDQDYLALKNVLFGRENRLLEDVREIVLRHDEQVGSPDRLQESVGSIIAGALRSAGMRNQDDLASAIAPVLIAGIKREIRNSRNEMVDALYPIMGRLTSAYVLSVFRDFIEETNRRLEGNLSGRYLRLRLKSLVTRTSYADLLLRETAAFRVQEILLIEADRGILLDRWRSPDALGDEKGSDESDMRLGGMLAAINRFSTEALKAKSQELRAIDLGGSQVYLRTTPKHLFAVHSTGSASGHLLRVLDKAILTILEAYEPSLRSTDGATVARGRRQALLNLAEKLQETLTPKREAPVFAIALFGLIGFILVAWIGWTQWEKARVNRIIASATKAINTYPDIAGYPVTIQMNPQGTALVLAGFVPSAAAKLELEKRVERDVPGDMRVESALLPVADPEKVTQLQHVTSRLLAVAAQIEGLKNALAEKADAMRIATIEDRLSEQGRLLSGLRRDLSAPERRLGEWVRGNAIFFADGTMFRDPEATARQLAEVTELLRVTDARLGLVGFTDPSGLAEGNDQLALNRAKTVAAELTKRGIASGRLATAGRSKEGLLSNDKGPASSNRRVEFRLLFAQEAP